MVSDPDDDVILDLKIAPDPIWGRNEKLENVREEENTGKGVLRTGTPKTDSEEPIT